MGCLDRMYKYSFVKGYIYETRFNISFSSKNSINEPWTLFERVSLLQYLSRDRIGCLRVDWVLHDDHNTSTFLWNIFCCQVMGINLVCHLVIFTKRGRGTDRERESVCEKERDRESVCMCVCLQVRTPFILIDLSLLLHHLCHVTRTSSEIQYSSRQLRLPSPTTYVE